MDTKPLETNVYVHSPLIEYTVTENYYTSYAIHLTSNNPCFNRPASHVRRRYSEFTGLRQLLATHHPTITPPHLPPKNYFQRFNDAFIEQRMKGLQKFLNEVLATPVYLSDKSLHLFLQSSLCMDEINEECLGDVPVPQLIDYYPVLTSSYSDTSSSKMSHNQDFHHSTRSRHSLTLDDVKSGITSQFIHSKTPDQRVSSSNLPPLVSSLRKNDPKSILIPNRNGSLDSSTASSPSSSPSSVENSFSSYMDRAKNRRVSFNDRVRVAVVTNEGISVLRP